MLTKENMIYCPETWQHEEVLVYYADQLRFICTWRNLDERADFKYIYLSDTNRLDANKKPSKNKAIISYEEWRENTIGPDFEPESDFSLLFG